MSTKYACKEQQQPPLRKDLLEMAPTRRSLVAYSRSSMAHSC